MKLLYREALDAATKLMNEGLRRSDQAQYAEEPHRKRALLQCAVTCYHDAAVDFRDIADRLDTLVRTYEVTDEVKP